MALVTVQRSPSPSASAETDEQDGLDTSDSNLKSPRQRSFSESYFTVKGAALILPQNDETVYTRRVTKSHGGDDIQSHLQAMFSTLRPQDTIKVAVKLEGEHTRYLAVVSCIGRQDTEESVVLGMDLLDKAHIGLVLPVWAHTHIKLDGDGGFTIQSESSNVHTFKPVSVQAMWSALQSLNKVLKIAKDQLYIPRGLSHTWVSFYEAKLTTESYLVSEWNASIDRDLSYRQDKGVLAENAAEEDIYKKIKLELKNVMMTVDLEEVTCLSLRIKIEEKMGMDLKKYKSFIDTQMMEILGQMDAPSMILDYLYLGSEWNASNLEELQINGVQHILNISREIDNFFPGILHYMNVREWDVEASDLLKYWEDTHKFINKSRKRGSKVLVHCKMGISRSGSTVIAYLMKEKQWSLQEALDFTKGKRSIVNPNPGFMKQLETYEGILTASWNKKIFDGLSGPDKEPMGQINESDEPLDMKLYPGPEDLLAARLGKDPLRDINDPFLHTEDDIEIASRSADSTEDSLGDSQLSPETLQTVHARKQAYLVGAKHKDESNDYPSSDSSGFTDSDELSSDGDEDLAGNDDKLGSSKGFVPIDLPEVLVENVDVRLKKLAKVEAKRCKSEGDKGSLTVDEKMMSSFSREGSMSKFRADGSWIKPPDEDDEADDAEVEEDAMEGKADTDVDMEKSESDIADMSSVEGGIWMTATTSEAADNASANVGGGTSSAAANDKAKCKTEVVVAQAVVAAQETPKEESSVDMEIDDIQKDQDEKGEHQYSRENIPWNPGTVLKQKQDIEERFGSIHGSTGAFRKTDSLEGSDTERVREIQSQPVSQLDDTQENVAKIPIPIQNQQPVSIRIQSSEKEDVNQSAAASCDIIDQSEKRKHEADQSEAEMRKSVYEEEEIELPEGIVRKTKQQIEERNRLSLESPRLKLKRSSSLKSNRVTPKSKDRDCERRRTCIVLLSPTHSGYPDFEGTSLQASSESDISSLRAAVDLCHGKALKSQASDDSDSDETRSGSVKVYKFMGEELTVEEGLVRKQTQDIESKAIEVIPKRKGETSPVSHEHCSTKSDTAHIIIKQAAVISSGDESSTDNKTLSKYSPTSIRKEKLYPNMVTDTDDVQFRKSAESSSASSTCSSYVTPKKHSVGQRPESRFDPATLALIREIGSALLNSPAKAELQEDDDVDIKQGESLVNHYVRKIEKNVGACGPRPKTRQIVIIDKDTSVGSDKSSSFSPVSSASPKTETDSKWSPRSKNQTSPSPGDTRKTPVAFEDKPISPKWSPVSRTRVLVSPKTVSVSNTGSPDITSQKVSKKEPGSPVSMETKASVATETTKTDDKACIDIEKQEACSVKDLRGKFEQPEQASGKVTPVHHSSVNTPPIPAGASSDRDTTSSSAIANHPALFPSSSCSNASPPTMKSPSTLRTSVHRGQSFQGQSSSSQGQFEDQGQMSTRSPRQQRHSEPVIQLNPESLRLFEGQLKEIGSSIFTKTQTISSPTMEESSDICSGVANKSPGSKAEGQQQQFPGARPKSAKGSRSEARPGQGRWSLGAKSGRGFLQHSKSVIESTDTQEEQFTWDGKKVRKSYGKSHPLAKLESNARQYMASSVRNNPFYSSM